MTNKGPFISYVIKKPAFLTPSPSVITRNHNQNPLRGRSHITLSAEGVSKCLRLITGGGGGGVGRWLRNQNFNFYPNTNLKFFI